MGSNSSSIPQNYKQHCHPQLCNTRYNKSQNRLQARVYKGQSYSNWQWNLSPLSQSKKYLFLPQSFKQEQQTSSHWCKQGVESTGVNGSESILAQYQPYVYTLENQILTRKSFHTHFREHQLWKIVKAGVFAIEDWLRAYPDIPIGNINPRNILFNNEGHIKIANQFSFLQSQKQPPQFSYIPPPPTQWQPNFRPQTQQSLSIFSLGVSLLDAVSLNQSRYSAMPTIDKKQILNKSNIYPFQIKNIINLMAEPQVQNRCGLAQVLQSLGNYRRVSREFF